MSIPVPIKSVGCQELIRMGKTKHHGNLRRRTKINKLVDMIIQNFKWRRNYVLIHGGCLYFFSDETNSYPCKATSLYGFNGCSECSQGEHPTQVPWVFKVNNALSDNKTIFLAAVSEAEMKKWIGLVREEIFSVNSVIRRVQQLPSTCETDSEEDNDSDYDEVEDECIQSREKKKERRRNTGNSRNIQCQTFPKPKPPIGLPRSTRSELQDEDASDYIESSSYNSATLNPPNQPPLQPTEKPIVPLPTRSSKLPPPAPPLKPTPLAKATSATTPRPPMISPKPRPVSSVKPLREKAFKSAKEKPSFLDYELNQPEGFWNGSSEEAEKLLLTKEPGTFLVRYSKNTAIYPLALIVKCEFDSIKKYQVFKTDNKYHLEWGSREDERFSHVDLLVAHYKHSNMPSKQGLVLLNHPYNHTPSP